MADELRELISRIRENDVPPVILIGGDSDYLVSHAWDAVREAIAEKTGLAEELWSEETDLARVAESYRTSSLFGGSRLLVVPEVHAFVTRKEMDALLGKAVKGWSSARTDRKRKSSVAKLMHVLGLAGSSLEDRDDEIIERLSPKKGKREIREMLRMARETGSSASRGEGDAAILAEMVSEGGAPGAHLLLKTGALPEESSTLDVISSSGGVILRCDLDRRGFDAAFRAASREIAEDWNVRIDRDAIMALRDRLGIDRILGDKWSNEVPDLNVAAAEFERLAALVGEGGTITAALVEREVEAIEGGRRFEIGSLITEGKLAEAVAKLRALVDQTRRENKTMTAEIAYGRFLFAVSDEVRQLLSVAAFCRLRKPGRGMSYNSFKATLADELSAHMVDNGVVSRKPHPFVLYKKFEAVSNHRFSERSLVECLGLLSRAEIDRKSGGVPIDVGLETAILSLGTR